VVFREWSCQPTSEKKGLFEGWLLDCYNSHGMLVIEPTDLMLTISLRTAQYLEQNAEKLRHLLVPHDGRKPLKVATIYGPGRWPATLTGMVAAIRENVVKKGDGLSIVDTLASDFSATLPIYDHLAAVATMSGLKHFFSYQSFSYACGIRGVYFGGVVGDFLRILGKITTLQREYLLEDDEASAKFARYLSNMHFIVSQFIATMQGDVDTLWWDNIMDVKRQTFGSGGQYNDFVTGWVVHLFGQEGRVPTGSLQMSSVCADVRHSDRTRGTEVDCAVIGGFKGVRVTDDPHLAGVKMFRPCCSLAVIEDTSSLRKMS